ncbi:hypothetical protein [Aquisalinus flavus]|uniref:Uncharacterized protein n=1 Tax=Aquisalinus flavus TaxID=1526572 RepID=A0A8J2V4J2_9PROT|nr:hypothetical protein [Aquisalinus flavus]MBD0426907.1 hypothetical protein [Aquisalinus flavus]UNE46751.1 hypothetical protein FF099_01075 [Aquisalinus flavus]GGC96878.1 hypothetical protein GCM10011342_02200 [Aquisalinus flavus]
MSATQSHPLPLPLPTDRTEDPALFIVSALRLFACPCAAPVHDTLREDSPARALLQVMRLIDTHARRPLRLHAAHSAVMSADETAFAALLAATQAGREREAQLRCRTMVRPAGQDALGQAMRVLARKLSVDGIIVAAPTSGPPSGTPCYPKLVGA